MCVLAKPLVESRDVELLERDNQSLTQLISSLYMILNKDFSGS